MSCKSSLCLRCAKVYVDNWVSQVSTMLHEGVIYRHMVLTVPEILRKTFYQQYSTGAMSQDETAPRPPRERATLSRAASTHASRDTTSQPSAQKCTFPEPPIWDMAMPQYAGLPL
jgi:hypothetical protein